MLLGEKIRNARVEAGLTQEELAEMIMVSRAAIAKWEGGRGLPDVANLKVIATTFPLRYRSTRNHNHFSKFFLS